MNRREAKREACVILARFAESADIETVIELTDDDAERVLEAVRDLAAELWRRSGREHAAQVPEGQMTIWDVLNGTVDTPEKGG